jgi:hypothetical protein
MKIICPFCNHVQSRHLVCCESCREKFKVIKKRRVYYYAEKYPCSTGAGTHIWTQWSDWENNQESHMCVECDKLEIRDKELPCK